MPGVPLTWDEDVKRLFETGVEKGVLFVKNDDGTYQEGVAWNGLISVTEKPTGGESNKKYADNIAYLNLMSKEEFGATIEAYTYPEEFEGCNGVSQHMSGTTPVKTGVFLGQQRRKGFGLAYVTRIGNDVVGDELGYKIHLIYNAKASPSERQYQTVNETPDAITMSWDLTTTPVNVEGYKPVANITIDSTVADPDALAAFEKVLFGSTDANSTLPSPDDVLDAFKVTP